MDLLQLDSEIAIQEFMTIIKPNYPSVKALYQWIEKHKEVYSILNKVQKKYYNDLEKATVTPPKPLVGQDLYFYHLYHEIKELTSFYPSLPYYREEHAKYAALLHTTPQNEWIIKHYKASTDFLHDFKLIAAEPEDDKTFHFNRVYETKWTKPSLEPLTVSFSLKYEELKEMAEFSTLVWRECSDSNLVYDDEKESLYDPTDVDEGYDIGQHYDEE